MRLGCGVGLWVEGHARVDTCIAWKMQQHRGNMNTVIFLFFSMPGRLACFFLLSFVSVVCTAEIQTLLSAS